MHENQQPTIDTDTQHPLTTPLPLLISNTPTDEGTVPQIVNYNFVLQCHHPITLQNDPSQLIQFTPIVHPAIDPVLNLTTNFFKSTISLKCAPYINKFRMNAIIWHIKTLPVQFLVLPPTIQQVPTTFPTSPKPFLTFSK